MDLEKHLEKAESVWLGSSYDFLKSRFTKTPLPSHDHQHHLRVWNYSKDLLRQLTKHNALPDYEFVEAMLLSSMFHDAGMIKVKDSEHGKVSNEIFNTYLNEVKKQPASKQFIEEAIEKHDDKTFSLAGRLLVDGKIQLLPALHISDDLDALGNVGIYRYSEIYLLRGIPFEDLGLKIIANLSGRYGNFVANCSRLPEMIMKHSIRHHTIESFFRSYNLQIRKIEETGEDQKSGPLAVVRNIYRQVLTNTPTIEEIGKNIMNSTEDVYTENFFKSLLNEL